MARNANLRRAMAAGSDEGLCEDRVLCMTVFSSRINTVWPPARDEGLCRDRVLCMVFFFNFLAAAPALVAMR